MGSQNKSVKHYGAKNVGADRWWHRVRDGTMSRQQLMVAVESLRAGFRAELEAAAALAIGKSEKSP